MSDDLENTLGEAYKQFVANKIDGCFKTLSSCHKDDPKVSHNTAIIQYLQAGGNCCDVLSALSDSPGIPNLPNDLLPCKEEQGVVGTFHYEGHEMAHYNRAVVMIHNSLIDDAVEVLRDLIERPSIDKSIRIRSAMLLQIALAPTGKKKNRTAKDDSSIGDVIKDNMDSIKADPVLHKMLRLSFADNSSLHEWFKDSAKTTAEKIAYFNNLGALAMNDGKPHLASVYFSNAASLCLEHHGSSKLSNQSVLYNIGVCALFRREYTAALKAFLSAQETMKGSPLLWLRITQAAIGLHIKQCGEAAEKEFGESQDIIASEMKSQGRLIPGFALLQIPSALSFYGVSIDKQTTSLSHSNIALKAIGNSLSLLLPKGTSVVQAAGLLHTSGKISSLKILQNVLINAAFLQLQNQNFSACVSIGNDLLTMHSSHNLAPDILLTVVLYVVEGYIQLNRPTSALKILQNMSVPDMLESEGSPEHKVRIEAVFINLVVIHIANGSWKTAQVLTNSLLSKISASGSNNTIRTPAAKCATLLQVYLDLVQGQREKAIETFTKNPVYPPAF